MQTVVRVLSRTGRKRAVWFAAVVWLTFCVVPPPARAIKIATFNLLFYDGIDSSCSDTAREPYYRTIFNAIDADIICVQEIVNDQLGYQNFLNNVLNHPSGPGGYAGVFVDGIGDGGGSPGGGDNALYYRPSAIDVLNSQTIPTKPAGGIRDWTYHKVRLAGYTIAEAEIHIFIGHLSADTGGPPQRQIEADVYRDWAEANLPDGAHVICCGDFNLDSSGEGAWLMFTETRATNKGQLRDPINRLGTWASNPSFADVHTQAPQTSDKCGTGCSYAGGGLDDRFDFLLTSASLHDSLGMDYVAGSYKAFGNDGQHYNKSINASPVIPEEAQFPGIATALACASDHLPVVLELTSPLQPPQLGYIPSLNFGTVIVGAPPVDQTMVVENSAPVPGEDLVYHMVYTAGFTGPTGTFVDPAGGGGNQHTITMLTDTPSTSDNGRVRVCCNAVNLAECPTYCDPGETCRAVILIGVVQDHAVPSTDPNTQVLTAALDFGTHPPGGFSDQTASVYNVGYNFYQSLLEVHSATVTGDARFSVVGFVPTNATSSPADFTVHFDDTGASPGVYTATLDFSTRDDTSLPGWIDLDTISFNLSATVDCLLRGDFDLNGSVDLADVDPFVAVLLDPGSATADELCIADMNADSFDDGRDIQPFVDALLAP